MFIIDENIFIIEVKSGLSEPRKAIDQGRLTTLTKAAKAIGRWPMAQGNAQHHRI